MTRRFPHLTAILPFILLLALNVGMNYSIAPLAWPDEALFSSPAIALAEHGRFRTAVLDGLIPGMDRATLWNSPLFMILLSGVYALTGESQFVARSLSFGLACLALYIFRRIIALLDTARHVRVLALLAICFDLTFLRAANTARMDMLSMCWYLGAFFFLIRAHLKLYGDGPDIIHASGMESKTESGAMQLSFAASQSSSHTTASSASFWIWNYFWTGICVGGAAISHPIAILLAPIVFIFIIPRWRGFLMFGIGAILPVMGWLVYIIRYPGLFALQFGLQLLRKKDIFSLLGGDTGGVFVVFSAQYGGKAYTMIPVLLVFLAVIAGGAYIIITRIRNIPMGRWQSLLTLRLYFAMLAVFILLFLNSEAWYPLYAGPTLLLLAVNMYHLHASARSPVQSRWPLHALGVLFLATFLIFTIRENFVYRTPYAAEDFQQKVLLNARECRSVYLRVRPDPYFRLRNIYPDMEVLEFVPGKLQNDNQATGLLPDLINTMVRKFEPALYPLDYPEFLRTRYREIDCFLLDKNYGWEPVLNEYLQSNRSKFRQIQIPARSPLENATLWRRISP